jgi:hypothetical protein
MDKVKKAATMFKNNIDTCLSFLGEFAKWGGARISFGISVRTSLLLSELPARIPLDGFARNLIFDSFKKPSQNANLLKIGQKYQALFHQ